MIDYDSFYYIYSIEMVREAIKDIEMTICDLNKVYKILNGSSKNNIYNISHEVSDVSNELEKTKAKIRNILKKLDVQESA